jgi:hypothetical protein
MWHWIYKLFSDPATAAIVDSILLLVIIGYEVVARQHDRTELLETKKQTDIAKQTYELYKAYFEVTEKRKAEARDKAAATRAAKKAAAPQTDESDPPLPTPPEGEVPPPMTADEEILTEP